MSTQYLVLKNLKKPFTPIKYGRLYFLSIMIIPIGLLVSNKAARCLVIMSFVLFCCFIVMNGVHGYKNKHNHKKISFKKELSLKKEDLLIFIIYPMGDTMWNISKYIYYDFLFGDVQFSLRILYYITVWHFLLLCGYILGFIMDKLKNKTTLVDSID